MIEWIESVLHREKGVVEKKKKAIVITLRWYFGYCNKREWSPVDDRNIGRQFWNEVVTVNKPEKWQKDQWADALQ